MTDLRKPTRRSFLASVTGGVAAAAGSLTLVGCGFPQATAETNCTDGDRGFSRDPAGGGRRCAGQARTGVTDSDMGENSDAIGHGRQSGARRASASGERRRTGVTDRDMGAASDPAGYGRGGGAGVGAGWSNRVTDSDSGPNADAAGAGRGGGWGQQQGR